MSRFLFVYGTLMKGCRNHKYMKGKYLNKWNAYTKGKLYHLRDENYPALLQGNDRVRGELYEIENLQEKIEDIDQLENYHKNNIYFSEYIRAEIDVVTEEGKKIKADAYLYNVIDIDKFLQNSMYIPEGYWKKFKIRV
ncbi:MAG: gamma-glutamylcyclotransferase family protein [Eubacteriales bacterium]